VAPAQPSSDALLAALTRNGLVEPERLEQLRAELAAQPRDAHQLGRELLQRGWLTAYQVNHLLQGKEAGLHVGPYQLLQRLGEGGMGQVYKARHSRLGRLVALKLIHPKHLGDEAARRRFLRETRSLSRLDHPNIVRALDAGEEHDRLYLVMELVEGTDLAHMVKEKGGLPIGLACECARQAALGLQHAHEQGLVHRDVKPSNLLLTADGTVKVLDLGLARPCAEDEGDSTSLTDTGMTVGTPDYVAPEQIIDSKRVDIRADLYSLGCTLYHLLAGRPPFAGGTMGLKLVKHQTEEPEPLAALREEVPAALAAVVQKLMAKKPEGRYQTPSELAAVLDHLLRTGKWAGGPFAGVAGWGASPLSWLQRARPSWQGRRLVASVALAVLMIAAAGLAVWFWPPSRPAIPEQGGAEPPPRPVKSPLEQLTFAKIRASERVGTGLLPETVQVLGSHQAQHGSQVRCLAFHPDGKRAYTGGNGGVVRVWSTATLLQQAPLHLSTDAVDALAVVRDPGGEPVLCASANNGYLYRWDAATLKPLDNSVLPTPLRCFSPDGRYGLSALWNGHARLFDIKEKRELKGFPDLLPGGGGAVFPADGKRALVAVKKGQFSLLETATGKELWRFHGVPRFMTRLAMTPNGKHVLSLDEVGAVWLWEAATNRIVRHLVPERENFFVDLDLSPDGRRAVLAQVKGNLHVWDLEDPHKLRSFGQPPMSRSIILVALTADGRRALTGNGFGRLTLWDLERGEELLARDDNLAEARCVALSPDGRLALSGHSERVTLHDVVLGEVVKTFPEKDEWIQAVAFAPDGSRFAYGGLYTGKLHLCRTEPAGELWSRQAPRFLRALVFSRDGQSLYSGGGNPVIDRPSLDEGAIRVWDTATGKPAGTLSGHTAPVHCLALSPDGTRLLSGAGDNKNQDCTVRLWDLASGKELKRFEGHTALVTGVAFAPDGKRVASVSQDKTVRWWDLDAAADKGHVLGQTWIQRGVAFLGDGQVVTAGDNSKLNVWDLDGKVTRERPLPHTVHGLVLSSDGRHLATANSNGTVHILRLPLRER
jgi:WD40 repeat protein/tRNA A-37 threonylcarbamoyl transferase component Bud32